MKKVFKLLVAIILAIVILGGVMFLVDCSKGKSGESPIFAKTNSMIDSERTVYNGLGYKIISFSPAVGGGLTAEIGPWSVVLQESKNPNETVIPNLNDNSADFNEEISGDTIIENVSGEVSISGDNFEIENISGDAISGDTEILDNNFNNVGGEQIDTEIITSGDNTVESENVNGDEEINQESEFVFEAVIIGINNNNLVVKALQDEAINASADMFSFSLNEENNAEGTEFLMGQNVKIEYTGTIAESYPAQIHVVSIEIAE